MSPVEQLLSRLEGVRETSSGQWAAKCPAHDDKSPSLVVSDKGDRILIHCFAGCDAEEVMNAVDLTLADLFDKPMQHSPIRKRDRWDARALLKTSLGESIVVMIAANQVIKGIPLSTEDHKRACLAVDRLARIVEMAA